MVRRQGWRDDSQPAESRLPRPKTVRDRGPITQQPRQDFRSGQVEPENAPGMSDRSVQDLEQSGHLVDLALPIPRRSRASTGCPDIQASVQWQVAGWPLLSDPARKIQKDLDIAGTPIRASTRSEGKRSTGSGVNLGENCRGIDRHRSSVGAVPAAAAFLGARPTRGWSAHIGYTPPRRLGGVPGRCDRVVPMEKWAHPLPIKKRPRAPRDHGG
jgi:hypothetical protein